MSDELKLFPCPFCGSTDVNLVYTNDIDGMEHNIDSEEELNDTSIFAYVHCYHCETSFMSEALNRTPKDVLEAWNSRV